MTEWMPLLVGIVTALAVIGGGLLAPWAQHRMQVNERRDDLDRARQSYQADTLIEVQIALQRFARASGAILSHDDRAERRGAAWGRTKIPEVWNRDSFEVGTALILLLNRVDDDSVRQLAQRAHDSINDVGSATSSEDAHQRMMESIEVVREAHATIGAALRRLPPPSGPYRPLVTSHVAEIGDDRVNAVSTDLGPIVITPDAADSGSV